MDNCVFLILLGLNIPLFRMMLAVGLPYGTFIVLRYISSSSVLSRIFIMKDVGFFPKICFLCVY